MAKCAAWVAVALLRLVFALLRLSLFVALILIGIVLRPLVGLAISGGMFLFLSYAILMPDFTTPMWAGLGLAAAGVVVMVAYHTLLSLVMPEGMMIIQEW